MSARKTCWDRNTTDLARPGPTHEVIARLAELIWEKEGRPQGRDIEIWLRAEGELSDLNTPTRDAPKP